MRTAVTSMPLRIPDLNMKKWYQLLAIFLLMLGLSGCDLGRFNADGSKGSDFSFNYPLGWKVLNDSKSTWVLKDIENIRVNENDDFIGFSSTTVGIGFQIIDPEDFQGKTPLEILTERDEKTTEAWAEFEARDESDKVVTNINDFGLAALIPRVYQSPTAVQICDKEIYILKLQWYRTLMEILPAEKQYDAFAILDGQLVQITGLIGWIEEDEFESIFEEVICSLEVHESE